MKKKDKKRSMPVRMISALIKIAAVAAVIVIGLNFYVIKSTQPQINAAYDTPEDTATREEVEVLSSISPECILVLGASVTSDGYPSPILQDRLDTAIDLDKGVAPKLLLSGDNGQMVYNEVKAMQNYALEAGVDENDIYLDHAGFSTYESIYRAKYIFKVDSMIVVTQTYHLYRSLYGCRRMGITAMGAAADQYTYAGQEKREIREVLARDKDFVKWIFKPQPTFLGDAVPISAE
ncbi:MAG: ElyC/SanA/YdcF family protein [Clostridia bacterium]